jgi:hypothetical protein
VLDVDQAQIGLLTSSSPAGCGSHARCKHRRAMRRNADSGTNASEPSASSRRAWENRHVVGRAHCLHSNRVSRRVRFGCPFPPLGAGGDRSKWITALTAMAVGAPGRRPIGRRSGSYSRRPSSADLGLGEPPTSSRITNAVMHR